MSYECEINGCGKKAVYCFEWYGVNQFGEDPEIVGERNVCSDRNHLLRGSEHDDYGFAESIIDIETYEELPSLLEDILNDFQLSLKF